MAKITFNGSPVTLNSVVGSTVGQFRDSAAFEQAKDLLEVPDNVNLEIQDGTTWRTADNDDLIETGTNLRLTQTVGTKG